MLETANIFMVDVHRVRAFNVDIVKIATYYSFDFLVTEYLIKVPTEINYFLYNFYVETFIRHCVVNYVIEYNNFRHNCYYVGLYHSTNVFFRIFVPHLNFYTMNLYLFDVYS